MLTALKTEYNTDKKYPYLAKYTNSQGGTLIFLMIAPSCGVSVWSSHPNIWPFATAYSDTLNEREFIPFYGSVTINS